ncbi:MAG TPA: VOC family protein [Streptosporangiaceae bacterium]|nr:VOC family protein [Streptosporangiaceae bacterium]
MTDPFEAPFFEAPFFEAPFFKALREPVTPVDPDPYFAEALRQRLTRRVFASPGGAMSQQTITVPVEREPAWPPALTPYIVVSDARRAMDWYVDVLGAQRRGDPIVNADGTIGHAEVGLGNAVLMLSEASDLWPDVPVRAPESPATFSHSLHLEVDDVDGTTERARRGGASVERPPADQPYGRRAAIVDPFGHRWILLRPPARAGFAPPADPGRPRQGDVANVTVVARDAHRAKEFYEAVLQVPFSSGHPGAWRTEQTSPPLSIMSPPDAEVGVQLSYRVDDLAAAAERVRAAGGHANEPIRRPFGLLADCVDDQGIAFRLWQPAS